VGGTIRSGGAWRAAEGAAEDPLGLFEVEARERAGSEASAGVAVVPVAAEDGADFSAELSPEERRWLRPDVSWDAAAGAFARLDDDWRPSHNQHSVSFGEVGTFEIDLTEVRQEALSGEDVLSGAALQESLSQRIQPEPLRDEIDDILDHALHPQLREEKRREMYSRASSQGSLPRETDALLSSEPRSTAGNLGSYDDKNGGEYIFQRAGGAVVSDKQPHCCPVCCTIFSAVAVYFLFSLGIYASLGWNYNPAAWPPHKARTVAANSFGAAALYFISMLVSLYYWSKQKFDPGYLPGTRRPGPERVRPHGD